MNTLTNRGVRTKYSLTNLLMLTVIAALSFLAYRDHHRIDELNTRLAVAKELQNQTAFVLERERELRLVIENIALPPAPQRILEPGGTQASPLTYPRRQTFVWDDRREVRVARLRIAQAQASLRETMRLAQEVLGEVTR